MLDFFPQFFFFCEKKGAMEVATALNNSAVGKLKAAWAAIPAKTKTELDELNDLTTPLGHYKNYRVAFAGAPGNPKKNFF